MEKYCTMTSEGLTQNTDLGAEKAGYVLIKTT